MLSFTNMHYEMEMQIHSKDEEIITITYSECVNTH